MMPFRAEGFALKFVPPTRHHPIARALFQGMGDLLTLTRAKRAMEKVACGRDILLLRVVCQDDVFWRRLNGTRAQARLIIAFYLNGRVGVVWTSRSPAT